MAQPFSTPGLSTLPLLPHAPSALVVRPSVTSSNERAMRGLLDAFDLLAHRGGNAPSWSAPFSHDPIAFLLDSMSDAANLWSAQGKLLYFNRAAGELALGRFSPEPLSELRVGTKRYHRRCLRCGHGDDQYILELISPIPER